MLYIQQHSWWRQQMETFSALLAICAGNSPVTSEFPAQRSVTRSFVVFFDLSLNERLSKQSWGCWLETPSRPLWRHSNVIHRSAIINSKEFQDHVLKYAWSWGLLKSRSLHIRCLPTQMSVTRPKFDHQCAGTWPLPASPKRAKPLTGLLPVKML